MAAGAGFGVSALSFLPLNQPNMPAPEIVARDR